MRLALIAAVLLLPSHLRAVDEPIARGIKIRIVGVSDVKVGDNVWNTGESGSLRVAVDFENWTGETQLIGYHWLKNYLAATDGSGKLLELQRPKHRTMRPDADGTLHEVIIDDDLIVGGEKDVQSGASACFDFPLACYAPGLERGKEYILVVTGFRQIKSFKVKF